MITKGKKLISQHWVTMSSSVKVGLFWKSNYTSMIK